MFFWYALLTHLPSPKQADDLAGFGFLSNRGLMLAVPKLSSADWLLLLAALIAIVIALFVTRGRGEARYKGFVAVGLFVGLFAVLLLTGRAPDAGLLSIPELKGLRFRGGLTLKPEFSALLIGLVLFGAAYIGEIIPRRITIRRQRQARGRSRAGPIGISDQSLRAYSARISCDAAFVVKPICLADEGDHRGHCHRLP